MKYRYSSRRRIRRQQKEFIARCLQRLPDHINGLLDTLPVTVVFKAFTDMPGYQDKCVYYQQTVYLPRNYWEDQAMLARWIKELNQATFIHECFHAIDVNTLTNEQRETLSQAFGIMVTQWYSSDWAQSGAELFADVGVAAFTDLPPHDRASTALQITPEAIAAVREMFT